MLFYFLGVVAVISAVLFYFRDPEEPFVVDKDLSKIQLKILQDDDLFVDEKMADQQRVFSGEYISPTIDYSMKPTQRFEI